MAAEGETPPNDPNGEKPPAQPTNIEDIDLDQPITKDNFDPEKFEKFREKLRDEAKNGTKAQQEKLREYESKIAEHEKEKLSETERLQRERDEAREEAKKATDALKERDTRDHIAEVADVLKFRDPKLAYKLIDKSEVELDDDGQVKNAKDLLTKISKSHPYLLKGSGSADGGEGGSGDPKGNDMNRRIREAAGRRT